MHAIRIVSFAFILFCAVGVLTPSLAATPTPRELADDLYRNLAAGRSLVPHIDAIFQAAGVPKLPANTSSQDIRTALGGKNPVLFQGQPELMEQNLKEGKFIDLDSFLAEMNSRGYRAKGTEVPLSPEYLASKWSYLKDRASPSTPEILPALLIELAQARTRWSQTLKVDATWGDGMLDPVQFTLFHYALIYLSAPQNARPSNEMQNQIDPSKIKDTIELGKESAEALENDLCHSEALGSVENVSDIWPPEIWHQQEGETPPYRADFTVHIRRISLPSLLPPEVKRLLICRTPPVGPFSNHPVEFFLYDAAYAHGDFEGALPAATDMNGKATAKYKTIREKVPPGERTASRKRTANVELLVKVGGWYPGYPRLTASIVTESVKVNYYAKGKWKGKVIFSSESRATAGPWNLTGTEFISAYLESGSATGTAEIDEVSEINQTVGTGCDRQEYKGMVIGNAKGGLPGDNFIRIEPVSEHSSQYRVVIGSIPLIMHYTAPGTVKAYICDPPPPFLEHPFNPPIDTPTSIEGGRPRVVTPVDGKINTTLRWSDEHGPFTSSNRAATLELNLEEELEEEDWSGSATVPVTERIVSDPEARCLMRCNRELNQCRQRPQEPIGPEEVDRCEARFTECQSNCRPE